MGDAPPPPPPPPPPPKPRPEEEKALQRDSAASPARAPMFVGQEAVNKRVGVYWDGEDEFYYGKVLEYDPTRAKKKYLVHYDDGEESWEYEDGLDFESWIARQRGQASGKPRKRKRPRTPPIKHVGGPGPQAKKKKRAKDGIVAEASAAGAQQDEEAAGSDAPESKPAPIARSGSNASSGKHEVANGGKKRKRRNSADPDAKFYTKKELRKKFVGKRVKVYWNGEKEWFKGTVRKVQEARQRIQVAYDDGDSEWEKISEVHILKDGEDEFSGDDLNEEDDLEERAEDEDQDEDEEEEQADDDDGEEEYVDEDEAAEDAEQDEDADEGRKESKRDGERERKEKADEKEVNRPEEAAAREEEHAPTKQGADNDTKVESDGDRKTKKQKLGEQANSPKPSETLASGQPAGTDEKRPAHPEDKEKEEKEAAAAAKQREMEEKERMEREAAEAKKKKEEEEEEDPSVLLSKIKAAPEKGEDAVGWRVEYVPVAQPKSEPIKGQVVAFKPENHEYFMVPADMEGKLGQLKVERGIITDYKERLTTQLLQRRFTKGDAGSVEKLLRAGANLQKLKSVENRDIFDVVLTRTAPHGRADMIRVLLADEFAIPCSEQDIAMLFKCAVNDLKNPVLLRIVLAKAGRMEEPFRSAQIRDELFRFCVDHVVKLNAEGTLDKLDQMVVETLANPEPFGFNLTQKSTVSAQQLSFRESRQSAVVEGTPLLQAMARGNIIMAIRLMDLEVKRAGSLSSVHWDCKLNDQFASHADAWGLRSPVRLLLFFFIVARSFSVDSYILKFMRRLKEVDPDFEKRDEDPALIFLCTLTEKQYRLQVRAAILKLCQAGADPNIKHMGETPLRTCVRHRNRHFIKFLVRECKADPQREAPLLLACELGYEEGVDALISSGARLGPEVLSSGPDYVAKLFKGKLSLLEQVLGTVQGSDPAKKHEFASLLLLDLCYASDPDNNFVKSLLKIGADPNLQLPPAPEDEKSGKSTVPARPRKPILAALTQNKTSLVKLMIDESKLDINAVQDESTAHSLLVWACEQGNLPLVDTLLEAGADVNAFSGAKYARTNALITALRTGNTELLARLLRHPGANVNMDMPMGPSLLHLACSFGRNEMVSLLLQHGAHVNVVDAIGRTPLAWACVANNAEAIHLLAAAGADMHHADRDGASALDVAIQQGNSAIALVLVEHGAVLPHLLNK